MNKIAEHKKEDKEKEVGLEIFRDHLDLPFP